MKNVGKALIIAGILSFCGAVFLGIGTNLLLQERKNGRNQTDTIYEEKQYTASASEITTIKTNLASDDVQIEAWDGDDIEVIWKDEIDEPQYQVSEHNGTLLIARKVTNTFVFFQIPDISIWETDNEDKKVTIKVPEEYAGRYDLGLSSGTLSVQDLNIKEELSVDGTSGSVKLENLICEKDVTVEMTSGNVTMDTVETQGNMGLLLTSGNVKAADLVVNGDLDVDLTSGSGSIKTAEVAGTLSIDFTSGNFNIDELTVGEVYADITSGDIALDTVTLEKGIYVSSTSGNADVSLTDAMDNYEIKTDKTSGYCNLPDYFGNGDKYITVDITSGSVEFSFGE